MFVDLYYITDHPAADDIVDSDHIIDFEVLVVDNFDHLFDNYPVDFDVDFADNNYRYLVHVHG